MALSGSTGRPSGSKRDPDKQAIGKCGTGEDQTTETSQIIMVMRHGERLDNLDHMWIHRAARPYDPPITEEGVKQAQIAGQRFLDKASTWTIKAHLYIK